MKNKKHNHNWTNLLKVFIFALMILMPFIVFMPNAFYYGFNEHAVAQEKTEQVPVYYESNEVTQNSDILVNRIYYWSNNYTVPSSVNSYNVMMGLTYNSLDSSKDRWNIGPERTYLTNSQNVNLQISSIPMYFVASSINYQNLPSNFYEYIHYTDMKIETGNYIDVTTNMSITDSMSYAWDSVWQNDLFSWTRETAIYNGINTTTNAIGINEQSYLADYLTYIILFTIIYVIIDIILGAFTMLTHIFNKEPK